MLRYIKRFVLRLKDSKNTIYAERDLMKIYNKLVEDEKINPPYNLYYAEVVKENGEKLEDYMFDGEVDIATVLIKEYEGYWKGLRVDKFINLILSEVNKYYPQATIEQVIY